MSRSTILNGLFLLAGCASTLTNDILYRIALVAILFALRVLWMRAAVKRALRTAFDAELNDAESVLIAEQNRRIAHRTA